ncbi:GMP synthase [Hymenobacter sp. UV11]|uniref:type 1 glutamine amidotransferase n=1 Tax=Hymenobacter sp. UV11 TaxID=1849735 RepID=UPI00105B382C|nr:GMP synthase [Hymenobacter sp. UV11]TDN37980.1 GMP synthase [Hymenobacter sp. UV11]TFZ65193.1 GMP synthase [Hymenobacter sp. UV11]
MSKVRIAILDMYNNFPNEGMRCIRQLLRRAGQDNQVDFLIDTFDVRAKNEVPDLTYDIYISSGGPGSPLPTGEPWEPFYFDFLDAVFDFNAHNERKKYLLLICHSFQLISRHLGLGEVGKRKSTSFGVLPVHLTAAGQADPVFAQLPEPFFAVDSRDYQLVDLHSERLQELNIAVLCLEKERPHVPLSRAIMALRFSPEILGTQFHPEADGEGMLRYMLTEERKQQVITTYGEDKYHEMVRLLADPTTIELTESIIVPTFLRQAVAALREPALA